MGVLVYAGRASLALLTALVAAVDAALLLQRLVRADVIEIDFSCNDVITRVAPACVAPLFPTWGWVVVAVAAVAATIGSWFLTRPSE